MIIQTVNEYDFVNAFNSIRPNNFSREALLALYEYLDELSNMVDSGTFELDVIGICCEWSEYASLEELREAYSHSLPRSDYDDDAAIEWLGDRANVIALEDGGLIIQHF